MKSLVWQEDNTLTFESDLPVPAVTSGSALLKVIASVANPNFFNIVKDAAGSHIFTQPKPLTPGANAIGRVVAVGDDATVVKEGQLVLIDNFINARDDPSVNILWTMHDGQTPESKKLHRAWRNGSYAEYVKAPLENILVLDEKNLCSPVAEGGLGYSIFELAAFSSVFIPFGGLRAVDLRPGETLIVSPATGFFSGAAINIALALGANVVAASRSAEGLAKIQKFFPSVAIVTLTGKTEDDTAAITKAAGGPADVFLDLSPPAATGSSLITACATALRTEGRIVLMGGRGDPNLPFPWPLVLRKQLTIKGGFMYKREDVEYMAKLLHSGRVKTTKEQGFNIAGSFKLEEWEKASETSIKTAGFGQTTIFAP